MKKLIDNKQLELIYERGKGAWTYHIVIPNTAEIEGKWGSLKVSGRIDNYELKPMNLAPRKEKDKMISINKEIRDEIGKGGGDKVMVTLFLHTKNRINEDLEIFQCFKDAGVLDKFQAVNDKRKKEIIVSIYEQNTEEEQIDKINTIINQLLN